jgi:hypothetical protein
VKPAKRSKSPALPSLVSGAETARKVVIDYEGARINELLGGIAGGATILLVGPGASGSRTATAELMARAGRRWNCPVHWLDADERDPALVRTVFQTAGVEDFFMEPDRVMLLTERDDPYTWAEAMQATPHDAGLLVVDTLEAWAPSWGDQLDLLVGLRRHPAYLKLVVSGAKTGPKSDVEAFARAADATVYAERSRTGEYALRFDRRRWTPCPSAVARGAGAPCPPPREPVEVAHVEHDWPDFSLDFTRQAACWGLREREVYLAHLRKRGVHPETIAGWLRVVEDHLRDIGGAS